MTFLSADPPVGYYDSVDTSTPETLRLSLHEVIDDHTRFSYTASSTDTWDILDEADRDPNNANNILDLYRNATFPAAGGGNDNYNREHSWPKSYGFPDDGSDNYPYTDCHHLFLCFDDYNSARNNRLYDNRDATAAEYPTDVNNGQGGGSGVYPGNSNWGSDGAWETWAGRRGDVARALFYMDTRYEGGTHGITGHPEPDLILTDNPALITVSVGNASVAHMGLLSTLLEWHIEDPVDDLERSRNDVVYGYQGNRNPFIDHPEWVAFMWGVGTIEGPPAAPTGLAATAGNGQVALDWANNLEPDLLGYNVHRSTTSGGVSQVINPELLTDSDYVDISVTNGTVYYYTVTAVNPSGESDPSAEVEAQPGASLGDIWFNEFHYDNASTDTGEFIEIAGQASQDMTGWRIVTYNGNGGAMYGSVSLTGVIPDQANGFGTLAFDVAGLQNGPPDGMALVDAADSVIQFLSYEGAFTATGGPASGMLSVDVGVAEDGTEPVGQSLQLIGAGRTSSDFTWTGPIAETPGQPNTGQTFSLDTTPPAAPTGLIAGTSDATVLLDWSDNSEPDLAGYHVHRAEVSGGAYTQLTTVALAQSQYVDTAVVNFTTYHYVVTAIDESSPPNESDPSAEVPATPEDITPPADPSGLAAVAGDSQVTLDWNDNSEPDLAGYNVHRSLTSGGPYTQINGPLVEASAYLDSTAVNGTTYRYVVTAVDDTPNANESEESAEVSATPGDTAPPAAPTGLAPTPGDGEVALTWNANGEPDLAGYRVHRATVSGGPYTQISGALILTESFTDQGVVPGVTYHYVVTAVDLGGLESPQSSEVSAAPLNISAPDPPVSLTATAGDGVVNLDWPNSPEPDIAGYTVYRGTTSGGPHSAITGSLLTASTHADSGVVNGTTYHYVVTATDTAAQESGQSPEAHATPADMTPPSPPTGLTALAGDAVVNLDWDDHTGSDVQGYHVYRAIQTGGPYARLTGTFTAASTYADSSVTNGLTYHYVVTAVDDASPPNESDHSSEASATPEDATPPAAPTGLSATASGEIIDLDWNDGPESDLAGYSVLRSSQTGGPYTPLNDAPLIGSLFTDLTAPTGEPQFYVITAIDVAGNVSPQSGEVSATAHDITPPAQPMGLTATPGPLSVILEWTLGIEGDLAGYHVERSNTSGGVATRLTSVPITGRTYTDQGVLPPSARHYTVIAVDTAGNESASSTEVSATPLPAPLGLSIH